MGWERFLGPSHSGEPPTDFEIHRAQMRHYDDYMVRHEPTAGAMSPGGSSSGGGSYSVAGPAAGGRVVNGGLLSSVWVDGPGKKDPLEVDDWGVYGQPPAEQSYDETRTRRTLPGPFGPITLYAHPHSTDIEEGAEKRLGDGPASWVYGIWTDLADWAYTFGQADREIRQIFNDHNARNWEAQRPPSVDDPQYQRWLDPFTPIGPGF